MAAMIKEDPSAAELFFAGRLSEALNEYDAPDFSTKNCTKMNQAGEERPSVPDSKAVYTVCNRAASKLELEMYRSCLRDCNETIEMDPFCLRAYMLKGVQGCVFFVLCFFVTIRLVHVEYSYSAPRRGYYDGTPPLLYSGV